MNCSIRIGGALVCILVGLGGCALLGLQGPTAEAAVLLPETNLEYADSASWDISGVPGDASHGNHPAIIASGSHGTRSAIYSSSSNFTTTGRLLLGHTATGNGTLTMSGGAGTLTFGGDSLGSANYVGVDGGTGLLNVEAGTLAVTGGAWLRIGSNAPNSTGTVNLSGSGAINVASHVLVGANQPSNVGVVNISGNGHLTAEMVRVGSNRWTTGTSGVGGQGTLNISGNGQLTTTGAGPRVFIGDGASGAPSATFSLADNGQVHSAHDFIVGFTSPGTGTQSGGTLHVAPAGSFFVGAFATGAHTQTGGSVIIAPGSPNGLRLGHGGGGNGTYNLNGGVLELSTLSIGSGGGVFNMGGGTLRAGGALNTAVPIQLTGGISTIDTNGQNVSLSGLLSGSGALTKTGAGTLTLTGANSYTGTTTVSAGVLQFSGSGSAYSGGTFAGNIVVEQNGTLRFARHDTFGNAPSNPAVTITVNGGTVTNSPGWFTPLGPVVLNQGTVAAGQGHSTWDAFLLKGTVTTVAAANSSYLTSTGANSAFHLNSTGTTFDVADGAAPQDLVVSGVLANYYPGTAGSLIKTGAGIMAVSGANTYTGGTTINDGTLFMRYDLGAGAGSGTVTVDGTGSGNRSNFLIWAPGAVTINNDFVLNSMGPAQNRGAINHDGGAGLVTLNGQITLAGDSRIGVGGSSSNDMAINGKITGPGKLYVAETTGRSTILTSGANDYSGGTEVEAGALRIGHAGALGSGDVSIADGANLLLWWNAGSNTVANNFTLNGLGSFNGKDAIYADGGGGGHGEYVLSGQITLNADSNIGGHNINHLRITGKVTGTGGLTKGGSRTDENNTLFLANTGNDYSGVTTFVKGTVNVASLADNGTASSLGVGTGDTVANRIGLLFRGGTLQYTGSTPQSTNRQVRLSTTGGGGTIDASGTNPGATLNFTGTSSLNFWENPGTRTLTLTGSNTGENTFALPIPDIAGTTTTNLTKSGAGTWVLGGNNSYAGTTEVNAGVLRMTGAGSLGAGGFATAPRTRVNPGATLEMTGTWSTNEHLHLNGSGAGGAGAIHSLSGTQTITTQAALNGLTTINVDAGATLRMNHTFYGASGSLTKIGPGTLELNSSNTYAGTTTVAAGILHVTGTLANNSSDYVRVASAGDAFSGDDPTIVRRVADGGTFAGLGSQILGAGTLGTTADLRAGTNASGGPLDAGMAWRTISTAETAAFPPLTDLLSDVLQLEGMDSSGDGRTDPFVLEMSYDASLVKSYHDPIFLAWLDEGEWINAVYGNSGSGGLAQTEYAGSWNDFVAAQGLNPMTDLPDYLGAWGIDTAGTTAWAVLNHNSQFAVLAIPEPAAWLLLLSALGCGLLVRRRR